MSDDRLTYVIREKVRDIIGSPGSGGGQDYSGLSFSNRNVLVSSHTKKIRDAVRDAVGQENVDRDTISVVVRLCEDALSTDGAHHKQWYLDQIVRKCLSEGDYEAWRNDMSHTGDGDEISYDEGIAP